MSIDSPSMYAPLASEPIFVSSHDLEPRLVNGAGARTHIRLTDLGYPPVFIARYPSELGMSEPMPILSSNGVAKVLSVVDRLREYAIWGGSPSNPGVIRGAAYRSTYLRDFLSAPSLLSRIGEAAGVALHPSAIVHQRCHINLSPRDGSGLVGNWHVDENSYVFVLMLHDPATVVGGELQYFVGTRWEGLAAIMGNGVPVARTRSVNIPAAGWGVLMQGSAVMHRAAPTRNGAFRISLVASFDPLDSRYPDQNPQHLVEGEYPPEDVNGLAEEMTRSGEFARHKMVRCIDLAAGLVKPGEWGDENNEVWADRLLMVAREAVEAAAALKAGHISPRAAILSRMKSDEQYQ